MADALSIVPSVSANVWEQLLPLIALNTTRSGIGVQVFTSRAPVLWVGDSGSKVYRTSGEGTQNTKSREPKADITAAFPFIDLTMVGKSGETPARLANYIEGLGPPDDWGVTVLSTFLNGVEGRKWKGEPAGLEGDFRRIGELMGRHRRPLAIVGGAADIWHYGVAWDAMV